MASPRHRWGAQRCIYVSVTGNAARPRALLLDEAPRLLADSWPQRRLCDDFFDCMGQRPGIARREKEAGFTVPHQLPMSSHVGRKKDAAIGHRFERFQRRDDFGEAHAMTWVDQNVDQPVIASHVAMRHGTREKYAVLESALLHHRLEIPCLGA